MNRAKEVRMETMIENLKWKPMWVSHLGCIKGCLDYLGMEVSDAWLYGATGHAFIINMHDIVCPSGPTAWNTEMISKLARNIGYQTDGVFALKIHDDFADKQKQAWEHIRKSIDNGLPCYGWELEVPEYYVIYGYDDKGYYFSGAKCDSGKGPKPWQEVGDTQIGCLEMYSVSQVDPTDDVKVTKDAFRYVLEHSKSPEKWIFPKYKAGLAGFDSWIAALETNRADGFGMAYNAEVWSECRRLAVQFLREAKTRLDDKLSDLFDEATDHYGVVWENLKKVTELFPFFHMKAEHINDETRCAPALEYLKEARKAEELGLKSLEKISGQL